MDPSAALVINGKVIAFSEEERHVRIKHAPNRFPEQAVRSCLNLAKLPPEAISHVAINWDIPAYEDGRIRHFFRN